jgi:hypothetical protein
MHDKIKTKTIKRVKKGGQKMGVPSGRIELPTFGCPLNVKVTFTGNMRPTS